MQLQKIKAQLERIRTLNEILDEEVRNHLEELGNYQSWLDEKSQNWNDFPGYPLRKASIIRTMLMIRRETIKLEKLLNGGI